MSEDGLPITELMVDEDGNQWIKYIHNDQWIELGIAPRPQTRWQAFVYHVCHGLIMRYSLFEVLVWSWRNRDSFEGNHDS